MAHGTRRPRRSQAHTSTNSTPPREHQLTLFSKRRLVIREPLVSDPLAKLLLFALENYAGDTASCWPSLKALQRTTCMARRTLQKYLAILEHDEKLIAVKPRSIGGRGNAYVLLLRAWEDRAIEGLCEAHGRPDLAAEMVEAGWPFEKARNYLRALPKDGDACEKPVDNFARQAHHVRPTGAPRAPDRRTTCASTEENKEENKETMVHGASLKPDGKKATSGVREGENCREERPQIPHVEPNVLQDDRQLRLWFEEATKMARPAVQATELDEQQVFALAVHARAQQGDPVRIFAANVRAGRWHHANHEHFAEGVRRLNRLRYGTRPAVRAAGGPMQLGAALSEIGPSAEGPE